jgi:hypothetical protein
MKGKTPKYTPLHSFDDFLSWLRGGDAQTGGAPHKTEQIRAAKIMQRTFRSFIVSLCQFPRGTGCGWQQGCDEMSSHTQHKPPQPCCTHDPSFLPWLSALLNIAHDCRMCGSIITIETWWDFGTRAILGCCFDASTHRNQGWWQTGSLLVSLLPDLAHAFVVLFSISLCVFVW